MNNKIRWGIIGLGNIAHKFAEGLSFVDEAILSGVASSSVERAEEFSKQYGDPHIYNSYEELSASPDIDIIYIASINTDHYNHTLLCLNNNKHVLCEKPFTLSKSESDKLFTLAKEKNLFCMEALWTRFLPSMKYLESLMNSKTYGEIEKIEATFGFDALGKSRSRLLDKKMGGGALYDIGIYPIFLSNLLLGKPSKIAANVEYGKTGVDIHSEIIYSYPNAAAELTCSFKEGLSNEATIKFQNATILLKAMWHCPTEMFLITDKQEQVAIDWKGSGYNYEIEYVSKCLLKGQSAAESLPAEFSSALIEQIEYILSL